MNILKGGNAINEQRRKTEFGHRNIKRAATRKQTALLNKMVRLSLLHKRMQSKELEGHEGLATHMHTMVHLRKEERTGQILKRAEVEPPAFPVR